jgi:hypothetical protein
VGSEEWEEGGRTVRRPREKTPVNLARVIGHGIVGVLALLQCEVLCYVVMSLMVEVASVWRRVEAR